MRNRHAARLALAAILTIGPALVATAQDEPVQDAPARKGRRIPVDDPSGATTAVAGQHAPDSFLLSRPAVQEELKLTADQKKKIAAAVRARRERSSDITKRMNEANQNPFAPAPVADFLQIQEEQRGLNEEEGAALERLLNQRQRTRLGQIAIQLDGPMAFAREDVLQKLNADDGQVEAIREILEETRGEANRNVRPRIDAAQSAPRGRRANPAEPAAEKDQTQLQEDVARLSRANAEINASAMQRIARVLRKKQMDVFNRLKGEPFDPEATKEAKDAAKAEATASQPKDDADPAAKAVAKPADQSKSPTRKNLRDRRGSRTDGN